MSWNWENGQFLHNDAIILGQISYVPRHTTWVTIEAKGPEIFDIIRYITYIALSEINYFPQSSSEF